MIKIKLLGGSKKSFLSDNIEIQRDLMTISDLLVHLEKYIIKNLPPLDLSNILVAVNGVDSSVLQGNKTSLKDGDVVSIIPLIHGGKSKRIQFSLINTTVELVLLKKTIKDPIEFLESLREKHPELIIQGIQARCILNIEHVRKILAISLSARRADTLLSHKTETDILMRFACTRQINNAISKVGVKKGTDSILIIIGRKLSLDEIFDEIKDLLQSNVFSKGNSKSVQKEFEITKKELDCIYSKMPLEDLIAERSATLFN